MAAVYMDGGFKEAMRVISDRFSALLTGERLYRDYKTQLQELTQERMRCTPVYRMTEVSGPDHARLFEVELLIKGEPYGTGQGRTKKEAEQSAARKALERFQKCEA